MRIHRRSPLLVLLALTAVASTACGGSGSQNETPPAALDFIPLQSGAPETAVWDDVHQVLYVVDNTANRVWRWTDAGGLEDWAQLAVSAGPTALPVNVTLGQAALLGDGTLVVNRFGQPGGGYGGIAYVLPGGTSAVVPNLDPTLRRLGLAVAPDGTLYGSAFAGSATTLAGCITTVDLHAGEAVVADGFGKIVGLVAMSGNLYVSDQSAGKIFHAPLVNLPAHASGWSTLATLVKPDQISAGPDGSLFSGQFQGAPGSTDPISVRRIAADGTVTAFRSDPDVSKPSGVAYDPTHRRLFVTDSGNSAHVGVHVFPVP